MKNIGAKYTNGIFYAFIISKETFFYQVLYNMIPKNFTYKQPNNHSADFYVFLGNSKM